MGNIIASEVEKKRLRDIEIFQYKELRRKEDIKIITQFEDVLHQEVGFYMTRFTKLNGETEEFYKIVRDRVGGYDINKESDREYLFRRELIPFGLDPNLDVDMQCMAIINLCYYYSKSDYVRNFIYKWWRGGSYLRFQCEYSLNNFKRFVGLSDECMGGELLFSSPLKCLLLPP